MRVLEAKDFLVQQTVEQAALENESLSDLEKRMMYFTETDECPEDPIALNVAFEAEYDTDEYEAKVSKLMRHAHSRSKKENPETARKWKEAVQQLSNGDHYILILCGDSLAHARKPATERPPYDSLKLLATALGVIAVALLAVFIGSKLEPQWRWLQKNIPRPNPHVLLGVFLALVLVTLLFQRPLGKAADWILDRTLFRFLESKEHGKDPE